MKIKLTLLVNFILTLTLQEEFPQIHVDVEYPPAEKDWNDYLVYSVCQKEKINEYTIVF